MFGFHAVRRSDTAVALASPEAPSPPAASTNGVPAAGVVPCLIVNDEVFTGGVVTPLSNVAARDASWLENPSRIDADAVRVCPPSSQRAEGSKKVYGAW